METLTIALAGLTVVIIVGLASFAAGVFYGANGVEKAYRKQKAELQKAAGVPEKVIREEANGTSASGRSESHPDQMAFGNTDSRFCGDQADLSQLALLKNHVEEPFNTSLGGRTLEFKPRRDPPSA